MAAGCERILHQSVLELDQKRVNLTLTVKYIAVEHIVKQRQCDSGLLDVKKVTSHCQLIPLEEIVSVQPHTHSSNDRTTKHSGSMYQAVELQPIHSIAFDVYAIRRGPRHKWRYRVLTLICEDETSCSKWIAKIRDVLHMTGSSRPKSLLVFVNPFGGKKQAPKVFEKLRFLFDVAGITLDVIETQRQNHARDLLQTYDLSAVDGVVCVGGDGTFSEVLNGLLTRTCVDEGVVQSFRHQPARPRLRIGVIPAGSTDSMVCTTVGTSDPLTSVLQIIVGCNIGVDVNCLYREKEFVKYSVTMTSYGYYGDLLADSEQFRWMGPKRYNFSGFKKFMLNTSYPGVVFFVPAGKSSGDPQDGNTCYTGCAQCQRAGMEAEQAYRERKSKVSFDIGGEDCDVAAISDYSCNKWIEVHGKFMAISLVTVSCRCSLSPTGMSPNTHLGDGCMDLILVRDCSRLDYLRHLIRIPRKDSNQFDLNFVEVHRVREFSFRPSLESEEEERQCFLAESGAGYGGTTKCETPSPSPSSTITSSDSKKSLKSSSSRHSVWNCDGEVVSHPCLYVQAHCQLIQMFAYGIGNSSSETEASSTSCSPCNSS